MEGGSHIHNLPDTLRECRPVKVLERAMAGGRMPHAILLHGASLDILELVGLALTADVLKAEGLPQNHPDFFTLRPAKKARSIRIGDRGSSPEPNTMRYLLHDLQQSASRNGYKVAMIYEADRMNDASANAFLKTLEEPPPQTLLLLLTTRPYDLLATIRSRCFQFRIPLTSSPIQNQDWSDWKTDYQQWLMQLMQSMTRKSARTDAVMALFGLTARFENLLNTATREAWNLEKKNLPENISDEEKIAIETGLRKGVRNQFFIDIEEATRRATHQLSHHIPFPGIAFSRSIEQLETVAGLMEVHLKEETALEYFMLQNLRIWTLAAQG